MVAELIDKYIWLIQIFINAGRKGLTLQSVSRRWENRYGEIYSRRTFNNHREAIADIFGIEIECDRSTNCYFIAYGGDVTDMDSSRQWLINTFTVNNLLNLGKERLSGRVSVENIPSGQIHLTSIMEAMDGSRILRISYKKYTSKEADILTVEPYAVKECQKRWYLVGFCRERKGLRVYGLDRILAMKILEESFTLPDGFNVDDLFNESFGVYLPHGQKAERIIFRSDAVQASYLNDLPLHPSQAEISRAENEVRFMINVVPDENMYMEFCRLGNKVEVLEPEGVRRVIAEMLASAANKYK